MPLSGKKLGLLLSAAPDKASFTHAIRLAEAALNGGLQVYLYCIDDAVMGLNDSKLQNLKERGMHLFACAYGAERRTIPLSDAAIFSGLTVVSDLVASTDRFLSFN